LKIRVLLFASVRQSAGGDELTLDLPEGTTAGEILEKLRERIPAMEGLSDRIKLAVGEEFVGPDHRLQEGDVAAIIPPMSGG
jgi:molybdopterin converting factor subunit 1